MAEWVENNKKNERIPRQIVFMETELCHLTSFVPNTPSNAVQSPLPHWHLLAGFGDPVLEHGGCDQALVGTLQDLQPCAAVPSDHTAGQAGISSGYQASGL